MSQTHNAFEAAGHVGTQLGEAINFERLAGTDDTSWKKAIPLRVGHQHD